MHPTPADLEGLVFGMLPRDEAERVADHLEQCPACEETVRLLEAKSDTYIDALRQPVASSALAAESDCASFVAMVAGLGDELIASAQPAAAESGAAELGQLGQYRLLEKLGDGGMGAVYKALHVKLKRVVALKVLPDNRLQDAAAIARFEREMEAAGQLQHLNIVAATDAGDHRGQHFLVMEYIAGRDVAQIVHHCGRLSVADACEIVRQAALGLACAHQHGLVHRDVKPSNLMLTPEGTVKVLDLGLALLAAPQSPGDLTSTGQVMGTIDYMAPEQVADAHRVDARADIYALGATLYKLLTGVPVYHGPRYETMLQKLKALASDPAPNILDERHDLPPALAEIVGKLLALHPAARPQSAESVAAMLAPFATGANLVALAEQVKSAPASPSAGSSVHSHQDGTRPAHLPPRTSAPFAKMFAAPAIPAATSPQRSLAWPITLACGALAIVVVLPLMCVGLTLALRLAATDSPYGSPPWLNEGRTPEDALRFDPGSLSALGFADGDVRYFQLTGRTDGYVWGTDIYTADSSLPTAAVHAGVLKADEAGIVKVTVLDGKTSHQGSTRNGVTSSDYGSWPQSMQLEAVDATGIAITKVPEEIHDYNGSFIQLNPMVGQIMRFRVTGSEPGVGSIWGTSIYTADSKLGTVAVHAGALRPGETGVVRVTFLPGLRGYTSTTRNGVTSSSWSSYALSYRVEPDDLATSTRASE